MAVSIDEMAGSPNFKFDNGRLTIHRTVKIAWGDIEAYMEELYPAATQIGNVNINRGGAEYPGNTRFRINSFQIDPFHENAAGALGLDSFGVLMHEHALVKMTYAVPLGFLPVTSQPTGFDPKPLLQHQISSGGQVLELPDSGFKWLIDHKAVPDKTIRGIFIATSEHQITDKFVLAPYWNKLETLKGRVNSSAFTLRGFTYPKETLLYLGYDATQEVMTDGEQAWTIVYKFSVKIVPAADFQRFGSNFGGHNHRWREPRVVTETNISGGFYRIHNGIPTGAVGTDTDGDGIVDFDSNGDPIMGDGPYLLADLAELFQAPPTSEIDE